MESTTRGKVEELETGPVSIYVVIETGWDVNVQRGCGEEERSEGERSIMCDVCPGCAGDTEILFSRNLPWNLERVFSALPRLYTSGANMRRSGELSGDTSWLVYTLTWL